MPKTTLLGGASIGGITDTETGKTKKAKGLKDDTAATEAKAAAAKAETDPDLRVGGDDDGTELPFDPDLLSVKDVNALLADCSEDERTAVLEAERKGQNRAGIVGK